MIKCLLRISLMLILMSSTGTYIVHSIFADTGDGLEYSKAVKYQNEYHNLRMKGNQLMKDGKYKEALAYHLKAFELAKDSSAEPVSRNRLLEIYENLGNYSKALEQAQWFLSHSNAQSPLWPEYVQNKQRLLKKIAESNESNRIEQMKSNLKQLTPEDQKVFVKSLSNESVEGLFKQAMDCELKRDFANALSIYEKLLPRKEQIAKEMNLDAWVMLYPGIQRTAELSGNVEKEKNALVWIKTNLLNSAGQYHSSAQYLDRATINHLETRARHYEL